MEAVAILRQLWRQRLFVVVGLSLALGVGIAMAYRVTSGFPPKFESRQHKVGIASAEMLVDSPRSQVADLGGGEALTDVTGLASRARLLANLMAISPLKEDIARRAGVDPRTLIATAPSSDMPQQKNALNSEADGPRANTLTINFNEILPIITANAQAPTPGVAARISSAAVEELKAYLKTIAATDKVPDARQLVIKPLGPARYATVARGPRRMFAIIAAVVGFALWCAAIVISGRVARSWREAASAEQLGTPPSAPLSSREQAPVAAARWADSPVAAGPPAEPKATAPPLRDINELPERPRRRGAAA